MQRDALMDRFFTALISGNRPAARAVVEEVTGSDKSPVHLIGELFWPALQQLQKLHKSDQLSDLSHHYATRLLRQLIEQNQPRLAQSPRLGKKVMVVSGNEQSEELGGHMASDLLEAAGFEVYYAGGGIANDEIVAQLGEINADVLVVFAAIPATVPMTRVLIDYLHDIGVCPKLQIVVGGGVFNRADGLAEEIGADLWAKTPEELVSVMVDQPQQRMRTGQRTVGRKRAKVAVA
jgi:methanogenic corrinoid protein MtbC1